MISENIIRYGRVSSVNTADHTVRVVFEDEDDLVSWNLPVLVANASKNQDFCLPDVGEYVVCAFLPNGIAAGFCLGSVYNQQIRPPQNSQDVRSVTFEDGTVVAYNRSSHTLAIDVKGSVTVTAAGNVTVQGDVVADGISLKNHVHGGVQPGGGNTAGPH